MSDELTRSKQFGYKENSNLVLSQKHRGRQETGPTGEVESLFKHLQDGGMGKMGSRERELRGTDKGEKRKEQEANKNGDAQKKPKKGKRRYRGQDRTR